MAHRRRPALHHRPLQNRSYQPSHDATTPDPSETVRTAPRHTYDAARSAFRKHLDPIPLSPRAHAHDCDLLVARAAEMRTSPSPPELLLWATLSNRKLGVSFRRQVPIAGYICDFVCASRRLIVEVDGAHHAQRRGAEARRDECLRCLGYRVLRLAASSCAAGASASRSASGQRSG